MIYIATDAYGIYAESIEIFGKSFAIKLIYVKCY